MFVLNLFILERTQSPFLVSLVAFFGMIPMLVLGVFGGVLADRLSRKYLLMATQAANLVAGAIMLTLLFSELILGRQIMPFWVAYGALLVAGTGWALDMPSRRSIVFDLLGKERVTNGIATDSIGMHSSMMLGPIFAGAITSFAGFSGGYVVIVIYYLLSVVLMGMVRVPPKEKVTTVQPKIARNLWEGFQYVTRNEIIFATIMITIFMNVLLFPFQQLVSVIAVNVLNAEYWQIGLLMGSQGVGSLVGGIMIASASNIRHHGLIYIYGSMLALVMLLLFSFSNLYFVSLPILVILGLGLAGFGTMQSTIVILAAREEMRSRALAVITIAIGTGPLGAVLIGAIAEKIGPQNAITINAIAGLITVGLIALLSPPLRRRIVSDNSREPEATQKPAGAR